jgi:predicted DNA-binding transcriptional regulator AlpA
MTIDTAVQEINQEDGPLTTTPKNRRPHNEDNLKKYLSVKEVARIYRIKASTIYSIIQNDPTFPYLNMGLKKKLMIEQEAFETWLTRRAYQEQRKQFRIPDLMEFTQRR